MSATAPPPTVRRRRVPTVVDAVDFKEACNSYEGWCTRCKAFTRDMVEPDATGYDCPECDEHTVMGAENALLMGFVTFQE